MKNVIKYYYNLDVSHIRKNDDEYYIEIEGYDYLFTKCDIEKLNENIKYLSPDMYNIVSSNGMPYIYYNDSYYVLMRLKGIKKELTKDDLISSFYSIKKKGNIKEKWIKLWSSHVDYIEYQMEELKEKYPYLSSIISYYIGLTETAIEFLNNMRDEDVDLYLTHVRITAKTTVLELNNPVKVVIDSRSRDIAEFIKGNFFAKNSFSIQTCYELIDLLSDNEKCLLFTRLIYPSYFFDIYDNIVSGKDLENSAKRIIDKAFEYEGFLKNIYFYIKKTTYIDNIDWLIS